MSIRAHGWQRERGWRTRVCFFHQQANSCYQLAWLCFFHQQANSCYQLAWQCFDLTVAHKLRNGQRAYSEGGGASVAGTEGTPDADSCPKEKIIRKCPFFYMARRGLVRRFWLARSWEA